MSLLWFMLGLAIICLLALNIIFLKKNRAEYRLKELQVSLDKKVFFAKNCEAYQLSARETEVLRLILEGHTYKSVAGSLFISEKTVDSHMQNIFAKVGVRNRIALIMIFNR